MRFVVLSLLDRHLQPLRKCRRSHFPTIEHGFGWRPGAVVNRMPATAFGAGGGSKVATSRIQNGLSEMVSRLIWFALFGLAAIGALVSVRWINGSFVVHQTLPLARAANTTTDDAPALPKGDRLPSPFFDKIPSEKPVATVKAAPIEAPKKLESPNDDIVSWHWHQGSKIVRHRRVE
jgi:hypothetical protein